MGISDTEGTISIPHFNEALGDIVEVLRSPSGESLRELAYDLDNIIIQEEYQ